jgi:hypothetical protein
VISTESEQDFSLMNDSSQTVESASLNFRVQVECESSKKNVTRVDSDSPRRDPDYRYSIKISKKRKIKFSCIYRYNNDCDYPIEVEKIQNINFYVIYKYNSDYDYPMRIQVSANAKLSFIKNWMIKIILTNFFRKIIIIFYVNVGFFHISIKEFYRLKLLSVRKAESQFYIDNKQESIVCKFEVFFQNILFLRVTLSNSLNLCF